MPAYGTVHAARDRAGDATPSATRSSPSPSANDPAGKACSEILDEVINATGMAWRLDDGQSQASPESTRKGGSRKCHFEASSTATLPPAIMGVTLYRADRRIDSTPEQVRGRAVKKAEQNKVRDIGRQAAGIALGMI